MTAVATAPAARLAWRARRASLVRAILSPPPTLTISGWADRYRMLSREASAEPGKWRTDRAPYLKGIMDAIVDPAIEQVVWMSAAQVGKTEIVNNTIGYYVDQDPSPTLVLQPTLEMAKAWSTDRLAPMLRDTPRLKGKVRDARSRDSGNTMLHKSFPGGHITIVGANSAAGLAARPIRIVLFDECDRFPPSAGTEGDPISLATKRTVTFWNRRIALFSTPTIKGFSRIEDAFYQGDQRHYEVPCPHCGHRQTLGSIDGGIMRNLVWEPDQPETAAYRCEGCAALIDETEKPQMLAAGEWVARHPGPRIASFWVNALYSPWMRWSDVVKEFLAAKGSPERLKVFTNTVEGRTWEETGDRVDAHSLLERLEPFPKDGETVLVPNGVGALIAFADVQGDRIEYAVWGFGADLEAWLVDTAIIPGDPGTDGPWRELEAALFRTFQHESGAPLHISALGVDSGGHHATNVYAWTKRHNHRRVFATKGSSTPGSPLVGRPTRNNAQKAILYLVGTETGKDWVMSHLKIRTPGMGYIHLPDWLDREHLEQLTSEKVVTRYVKGRPVRAWVKTRDRNEQLDLLVGALAMLHALGPSAVKDLAEAAKRVMAQGESLRHTAPPTPLAGVQVPPAATRPPRRGFVNNWRR